MTIHDDARAAAEAVYDAELARRTALVDASAEQLETVTLDRDRLAAALAASEDDLAAARARIAALEAGKSRPLVSVYSGMTGASDDPFVSALAGALTAGTSYYTGSAYKAGVFTLTALDKARIARGAALFVTYSASVGTPYTDWADVAEGKADDQFRALATVLKDAPAGSSFSFANEPETRVAQKNQRDNGRNRPEDFAAAHRHVVEVMRQIAPKLDYRWWIAGGKTDAEMEKYYPGDAWVDSIGYDPYVWSWNAPTTTASEKYAPVAQWLRSRSWGKGKPLGLSETGFDVSKHGEAAASAFWASVPQAVADLDLRFVTFFNRGEWTTFPNTKPTAWAGYVAAMKQISGR